jgi:5-methylcytosine-specific restriction endonuclease McrA
LITLHEETLALVKEERRLTGLIIENLQKISDSKLFLEMGYSSLFQYCTKALGYSEASAYRRIEAVKVMRVVPEVKEKLNSGELNLTTVAIAQNFFKTNCASVEVKRAVLQKIEGCSKPETEKILATLFDIAPPKQKEKIHFHREGAALQIHLPDAVLKKLDHIKSLRSHKNPNMSYAEVIEDMCEIVLKKIDPIKKAKSAKNVDSDLVGADLVDADLADADLVDTNLANADLVDSDLAATDLADTELVDTDLSDTELNENSKKNHSSETQNIKSNGKNRRYISAKLKSAVWLRDQGHCTFTDNKTGRRCNSKHLLQLDHNKPLFLGGETAEPNLRLLCHAHHQLRNREFNVF